MVPLTITFDIYVTYYSSYIIDTFIINKGFLRGPCHVVRSRSIAKMKLPLTFREGMGCAMMSRRFLRAALILSLWIVSTYAQQIEWRGVDLSQLLLVEEGGGVFFDAEGVEHDILDILANNCINVARINVWNDPTDGCCSLEQALKISQRLDDVGIDVMPTFHFSDTW